MIRKEVLSVVNLIINTPTYAEKFVVYVYIRQDEFIQAVVLITNISDSWT